MKPIIKVVEEENQSMIDFYHGTIQRLNYMLKETAPKLMANKEKNQP